MAKDFKKTATTQAPVYSKLLGTTEQLKGQLEVDINEKIQEVQEVQEVQETQPKQEAAASLQTQGRKGEKLPRINMAFSPANHEFISIMARIGGLTLTQYVNKLIDAEREANADAIEQAKKLFNL